MATFFFGLEVVSPLLLRFSEPMACCLYLSMKISHARRISDFFLSIPPLSGRKRKVRSLAACAKKAVRNAEDAPLIPTSRYSYCMQDSTRWAAEEMSSQA